jgi:dipeptidyl aminopeptidase/acylaminoacyl peptidase
MSIENAYNIWAHQYDTNVNRTRDLDEIVAGVRKNGVTVEYVLFEDEGHGFVKKENQIEAYSRILKFLDVYLKNENQPIEEDVQKIKG